MKWLNNLLTVFKKGKEYDGLLEELRQKEIEIKVLERVGRNYEEFLEEKDLELLLQSKDLEALEQQLKNKGRHSSLNSYKEWLESNTTPSVINYDFGKGSRRVHSSFKESLQYREELKDFLDNYLKFTNDYDTADELMFQFNVVFNNKYPTVRYYRTDQIMYGKVEYWANVKETIKGIKKGAYGDCDDVMVLKYCLLRVMLDEKFPEDVWRLRGFIVDILTYGGHAMLGWVKGGDVNDFVPIETTFMEVNQSVYWRKNYTIRNQIMYQIRYSFDDKAEYTRI